MVVVGRCSGVVVLLLGGRVVIVVAFLGFRNRSCPADICTALEVSCLVLFCAPAQPMSKRPSSSSSGPPVDNDGPNPELLAMRTQRVRRFAANELAPETGDNDLLPETNPGDIAAARPATSPKTEDLAPAPMQAPVFMVPDDDEERADLPGIAMICDALQQDGFLEFAETHNMRDYLGFFENPGPGQNTRFAMTVIEPLRQHLTQFDELSLNMSDQGDKFLQYNAKGPHGTWVYNDPPSPRRFLDVKLNPKFGNPDNEDAPEVGNWLRFQRIPGTKTWIRCCDVGKEPTSWTTWFSVLASCEIVYPTT